MPLLIAGIFMYLWEHPVLGGIVAVVVGALLCMGFLDWVDGLRKGGAYRAPARPRKESVRTVQAREQAAYNQASTELANSYNDAVRRVRRLGQ